MLVWFIRSFLFNSANTDTWQWELIGYCLRLRGIPISLLTRKWFLCQLFGTQITILKCYSFPCLSGLSPISPLQAVRILALTGRSYQDFRVSVNSSDSHIHFNRTVWRHWLLSICRCVILIENYDLTLIRYHRILQADISFDQTCLNLVGNHLQFIHPDTILQLWRAVETGTSLFFEDGTTINFSCKRHSS